VPATTALKQLAGAVPYDIVHSRVAARAPKSASPTRSLDGLSALRLSSNATKELRNGHAGLKLDLIQVHRARSVREVRQRYELTGAQGEPAEAGFQSGVRIVYYSPTD